MRCQQEGRFASDAAAIDDPTLDPELDLSRSMLELITERAAQGTLQGPWPQHGHRPARRPTSRHT